MNRLQKHTVRLLAALFGLMLLTPMPNRCQAKVRIDVPFTNHMVLQRKIPVPIWGLADAGEEITVNFAGKTKTAVADAGGQWLLRLEAMEASGEPADLEVIGKGNKIVLENVVVGDVWVYAGDLTMMVAFPDSLGAEQEMPLANYPLVRVCTVGHHQVTREPQRKLHSSGWIPCFPQTVNFPAVAYYFARDLNREMQVPIGVIAMGMHTLAESWCSEETAARHPGVRSYVEAWKWLDDNYKIGSNKENLVTAAGATIPVKTYANKFRDWQLSVFKSRAAGQPVSDEFPQEFLYFPPYRAPWPLSALERPAGAYNTLLAPLIPYGIKGLLWDHGVANLELRDPTVYRAAMEACLTDWRSRWETGEFPVLITQLGSGGRPIPREPVQDSWAIIREQQALLGKSAKNVWMAATYDAMLLEEPDTRFSTNKEPIGRRLASLAVKQADAKAIETTGPVYQGMSVDGATIRIRFQPADKPLMTLPRPQPAEGLASATPESELRGFAIAGKDRKWFWADARIEGDSVIVWNEQVAEPVAVRYAWTDFIFGNLGDSERQPAVPFRTDDWPFVRR